MAACLALGCMSTSVVSAMPSLMGLGNVQKGMQGEGYTVVDPSGSIRSFDVDILGVLGSGKGASKRILAKASGDLIHKTGGALQGMSGSPVYIDGKLVGALSAGYKDMDPYTFLITPIEDMLAIWDMPDRKNRTAIPQVALKKPAEEEKPAQEEALAEEVSAGPGQAEADAQQKAVLAFAGFSPTGAGFVQKQLAPLGIDLKGGIPISADVGTGQVKYNADLSPGSAIGVAVVYGDFTIGATGTVTAVEDNQILAFGHPFLHKGNVNYFLTDATVVGSVSGQSDGMKLANVGSIIGRVNQDREAGISGIVGTFPAVVPIRVTVKDSSLSRDQSYAAQIAYDEEFIPTLSAGIAYAAMAKTVDDLGGSTAKVHFTITTDAATDGTISRDNLYYNTSDVGQIAVSELAQALNIICGNVEKEFNVVDVHVDIQVESSRKTASLVAAAPSKVKVKPGETIKIKTTLKPYRSEKETVVIPYTVPKEQPAGLLQLDLRGGGLTLVSAQSLMLQQAGVGTNGDEAKAQTVADRLRSFIEAGKNNEIIVAPSPTATPQQPKRQQLATAGDNSHSVDLLGVNQQKSPQKASEGKFSTQYIIDNIIHATLQVEA